MLLLNIIIEENNALNCLMVLVRDSSTNLIFSFFKNAVSSLEYKKQHGARAGIRTRVDGMKTRNDGPGYTTRATAKQPDK